MRFPSSVAAVLLIHFSTPSPAADCAAATAMSAGTGELQQRKDLLQRREWLLLDYLSSDGSKKSRKLFDAEVAKSQERTRAMLAHIESLAALPPDTPDIPQDGSPACETLTRVKTAIEGLLDARDKELLELSGKKFPFLNACDEIGVKLVNLANSSRKPEVTPRTASLLRMTLDIALGPQIHQARMPPDAFGKLVDEVFAPGTLSPRTVAGYGALRCVRTYQRAEIRTLAEATVELAQCPVDSWLELGPCIEKATRR